MEGPLHEQSSAEKHAAALSVANGLIVANSLVGAIRAAGPHSGAATGLCGALQMACSAGLGSLGIWLGGDADFPLAVAICWVMTAVGLMCGFAVIRRCADD